MKRWALIGILAAALVALLAMLGGQLDDPTIPDEPPAPKTTPAVYKLHGRVLSAAGAALAGVEVQAFILEPGVAYSTEPVATDAEGRFRLLVFPPRGRWEARAFDGELRAGFDPRPGGEGAVELRRLPAPSAKPDAEPEDRTLSGTITDSRNRLVVGAVIEVLANGERWETVSGDGGIFSIVAEAPPPLRIRPSGQKGSQRVSRVPEADILLILTEKVQAPGTLTIEIENEDLPPDVQVELQVRNSVGELRKKSARGSRARPLRVQLEYDEIYDLRVFAGDLAGTIQGFDFRPGEETVRLRLEPAGRITGAFDQPTRVALIAWTPVVVPLSRTTMESMGEQGAVLNLVKEETAALSFDFRGIPAGDYVLRTLGKGMEIEEQRIYLGPAESLDLGLLRATPAHGRVTFVVTGGELPKEHAYRLRLYTHKGHALERILAKGGDRETTFSGLSKGRWWYRLERFNEGGGVRWAGWDLPIDVDSASEALRIEIDGRFPWEK
jgi:hypothetical protein